MLDADKLHLIIAGVLEDELYGAYDCVRVWEAWSYNTMRADDFIPVEHRLDDIVHNIVKEILKIDIEESK